MPKFILQELEDFLRCGIDSIVQDARKRQMNPTKSKRTQGPRVIAVWVQGLMGMLLS